MHKNPEQRPADDTSSHPKPKTRLELPHISHREPAGARQTPWSVRRNTPLREAIEERFARIFVPDVIDLPRRAARGDSDPTMETETLT